MSSRDEILAAVRASKPAAIPPPNVGSAVAGFELPVDPVRQFVSAAESAGVRVVHGTRAELTAVITAARTAIGRCISALDVEVGASAADQAPNAFADTDVFVCEAELGVAENGAVWLPLSRLRHRSAVFLATHVVVLLERARIVPHLHAAYARIDLSSEGFGILMAGPSKTADIEQALVVGAHGAKSVTVLLV